MAKGREIKLPLPAAADLFSTQEERDEAKREFIADIPLEEISDFPDHPYKVKQDESMLELAASIREKGVVNPALVRPKPEGGYEMVAGHRRKFASELAGKTVMPCIVRNLTDDEATIIMVDSNLQREKVLPSEKAFAYKMKLEAMNRQAGRPSKNMTPVVSNSFGVRTNEVLAKEVGESRETIRRLLSCSVYFFRFRRFSQIRAPAINATKRTVIHIFALIPHLPLSFFSFSLLSEYQKLPLPHRTERIRLSTGPACCHPRSSVS